MLWVLDQNLAMLSTNGADNLSLTPNNSNRKHQNPRTNMHAGIALNPILLAKPAVLPRTPYAKSSGKIGCWNARCWSTSSIQKDPNKKPLRHGHNGRNQKQTHSVHVGNDYVPQCDEVCVNTTKFNTDALTEAWATVSMPTGIGLNQCGSLQCKIKTGTSINVMPL